MGSKGLQVSLCLQVFPVYQTAGRGQNTQMDLKASGQFVLCCGHTGPSYVSQPFNFNAAVVPPLRSVSHV